MSIRAPVGANKLPFKIFPVLLAGIGLDGSFWVFRLYCINKTLKPAGLEIFWEATSYRILYNLLPCWFWAQQYLLLLQCVLMIKSWTILSVATLVFIFLNFHIFCYLQQSSSVEWCWWGSSMQPSAYQRTGIRAWSEHVEMDGNYVVGLCDWRMIMMPMNTVTIRPFSKGEDWGENAWRQRWKGSSERGLWNEPEWKRSLK